MTRPPGRWALGLWLLFLLVGLSSQLAFFTIAPELVGDGHRPMLAIGAAIAAELLNLALPPVTRASLSDR